MKVHILTWHKELNHGAILQAYASQEMIKELGYNVDILDYKRDAKVNLSFSELLSIRIKRLLSGDYKYRNTYSEFRKEKADKFRKFMDNNLELGRGYDAELFDCVMIGSDMVFNLIEGYSPFMFGIGINSKYLFSYAACSGGSSVDLADRIGVKSQVCEALKRFNHIGCRDKSTIEFVNLISDRNDMVENIDPVLLYGFSKEQKLWNSGKWKTHKPYVLIYAYHGNLNNKDEIDYIRKYANANKLQVISCGNYHSWCDENVNAAPDEFLEMFVSASAIVTDTFHGTVFSLICQKKFCSIIRGNAFKLKHLLESVELDYRIAYKPEQILGILGKDIDYTQANIAIDRMRDESKEYLAMNLESAQKIS